MGIAYPELVAPQERLPDSALRCQAVNSLFLCILRVDLVAEPRLDLLDMHDADQRSIEKVMLEEACKLALGKVIVQNLQQVSLEHENCERIAKPRLGPSQQDRPRH